MLSEHSLTCLVKDSPTNDTTDQHGPTHHRHTTETPKRSEVSTPNSPRKQSLQVQGVGGLQVHVGPQQFREPKAFLCWVRGHDKFHAIKQVIAVKLSRVSWKSGINMNQRTYTFVFLRFKVTTKIQLMLSDEWVIMVVNDHA